jgi:thiosulfate/3-mercaptopyruvate sulfurtransferase
MGERTSLLDGGLKQWKSEGRPVTADIPEFTTGNFTPQPHEDLIVQAAWIEENLRNPEVVIVDARPREHYDGQETGGGIARYGHIAGAVSIPVTDIMRDDPAYLFKERLALLEMFTAAGAKPGSQLIIYCNSGIWATSVYVTARYLGYDVRFYDGSFQDWCQVETRPIIEPAKKRFSLSGLLRKIFR